MRFQNPLAQKREASSAIHRTFTEVSSLRFLVEAQRACGVVSARRPLTHVKRDRRPVLLPRRSVDTRVSTDDVT
jgi:hypothetical protein